MDNNKFKRKSSAASRTQAEETKVLWFVIWVVVVIVATIATLYPFPSDAVIVTVGFSYEF